MIFRPASPLIETTRKAAVALTRRVRSRSSGLKLCVKCRKKGTAPIGLTMASRAISGLSRSIRRIVVRGAAGRPSIVGGWAQGKPEGVAIPARKYDTLPAGALSRPWK